MNKIDELIESISNPNNSGWGDDQEFFQGDVERIMKEYADFQVEKFKKNLLSDHWSHIDDCGDKVFYYSIIESLKLPEHE